jgi:NAD(P)-dependent dehydrogenase (short-subunit alcohol dehydrogenase family)
MSQGRLRGRTALVTGAGRRIGRAIALALAQAGVNVAVHYSSSGSEAGQFVEEVKRHGVQAWAVHADFNQSAETETLIARTLKETHSLDFLVNSAAIFLPGTLRDLDFAGLMEHMRVNAWTPLLLSRDFARLAGTGKIVNLLDARIAAGDSAHVGYLLSKQALAGLTRMMALEFAPRITVNGIAPGPILPPPGKGEGYLRQVAETVPLQRHGEPADIAAAALYLLESDFVTGQILYVDGGQHLKEPPGGSNPDS